MPANEGAGRARRQSERRHPSRCRGPGGPRPGRVWPGRCRRPLLPTRATRTRACGHSAKRTRATSSAAPSSSVAFSSASRSPGLARASWPWSGPAGRASRRSSGPAWCRPSGLAPWAMPKSTYVAEMLARSTPVRRAGGRPGPHRPARPIRDCAKSWSRAHEACCTAVDRLVASRAHRADLGHRPVRGGLHPRARREPIASGSSSPCAWRPSIPRVGSESSSPCALTSSIGRWSTRASVRCSRRGPRPCRRSRQTSWSRPSDGRPSAVGLAVEPGLVAEMIADTAHQPGALPLLQYALTELFERRDGARLTLAAYRAGWRHRGRPDVRADRILDGLDAGSTPCRSSGLPAPGHAGRGATGHPSARPPQ